MGARPLHEIKGELVDWATSDIPRVRLGYSFFDQWTNGVATGELCTLIARSGVGKTYFLLNVIRNNPKTPCVVFSMEMHARYLLARLASINSGEATWKIEETLRRHGRHWAVDTVVDQYPHLHIDDEPTRSVAEMGEVLERYETDTGVSPLLVGIDYLELVRSWGMNQTESVDEVARALKAFAREFDVAVLVLHQVTRGERHKPKGWDVAHANEGHRRLSMTDARFGGDVQSDYLLGMYRPSKDPTMPQHMRQQRIHDVRLQFLKNRAGFEVSGEGIQHHWDPRTGLITQIDNRPLGGGYGLHAVAG